jgi:hypothetical protein
MERAKRLELSTSTLARRYPDFLKLFISYSLWIERSPLSGVEQGVTFLSYRVAANKVLPASERLRDCRQRAAGGTGRSRGREG